MSFTTALERTRSPFESLPVELVQHVGALIERDQDFCNLMASSKRFLFIFRHEDCFVWRERFLQTYDRPPWLRSDNALHKERVNGTYKARRILLRLLSVTFKHSVDPLHDTWLDIVRDLVVESFATLTPHTVEVPSTSKNLTLLRDLLPKVKFFDRCTYAWSVHRMGKVSELYSAIQLLLTPFVLDLSLPISTYGGRSDYFMPIVYMMNGINFITRPAAMTIHKGRPFVIPNALECRGADVKLDLHSALQIRNFWKRHLLCPAEGTFCKEFKVLPKPLTWSGPLKDGFQPVGRRWEGFYSMLGPRFDRRQAEDGDQMWMEFMDECDRPPYMWMDITFSPGDVRNWFFEQPPIHDPVTYALRQPAPIPHWFYEWVKARKQSNILDRKTSHMFAGHGRDVLGSFAIVGIQSPSGSQCDIPGWQHIWFIKWYVNPHGSVEVPSAATRTKAARDMNKMPSRDVMKFLFHGIVLPGARVMLGWWSGGRSNVEGEAGPWIFWWAPEDDIWKAKSASVKRTMQPESVSVWDDADSAEGDWCEEGEADEVVAQNGQVFAVGEAAVEAEDGDDDEQIAENGQENVDDGDDAW